MLSYRPLLPTLATFKTGHLLDLPVKLLNLPTDGTVLSSFTRRILSQVVGRDTLRALGTEHKPEQLHTMPFREILVSILPELIFPLPVNTKETPYYIAPLRPNFS